MSRPGPRAKPLADRFWPHVAKTDDGCWLWTGYRAANGYGRIPVPRLNHKRPWTIGWAHRVSYALNVGPITEGLSVLHRCDNPQCVRPDHLFLGTQRDNIQDAARKGRTARGDRSFARLHPERLQRGEQRPNAKLTLAIATEIRARLINAPVGTAAALARTYGVSPAIICGIRKGKLWKTRQDNSSPDKTVVSFDDTLATA